MCGGRSSVLELLAREHGWQFTARIQSISIFLQKKNLVEKHFLMISSCFLGSKFGFWFTKEELLNANEFRIVQIEKIAELSGLT